METAPIADAMVLRIGRSTLEAGEAVMAASSPFERDFSRKTIRSLAKRGVRIVGLQAIPGDGPMPFANADRGYLVDDNGCGRVWRFADVMREAGL